MDAIQTANIRYYQQMSAGERLRMALQMMQDGFDMQRTNLRRRNPQASDEEVETMLRAWMLGG